MPHWQPGHARAHWADKSSCRSRSHKSAPHKGRLMYAQCGRGRRIGNRTATKTHILLTDKHGRDVPVQRQDDAHLHSDFGESRPVTTSQMHVYAHRRDVGGGWLLMGAGHKNCMDPKLIWMWPLSQDLWAVLTSLNITPPQSICNASHPYTPTVVFAGDVTSVRGNLGGVDSI